MPTLPKLPYTDDGKRINITSWTGLKKSGDGAMYDGLNMCSDYYPNIATRLGFAKVGLRSTLDFAVKAVTTLADGSGIVYIGERKAAIHDISTGTIEKTTFPKTITVEPTSVVTFIRTATMESSLRYIRYEYKYYITLIASAKAVFVKEVRTTVNTTNGETSEETLNYAKLLGDEKVYSIASPRDEWQSLSTVLGNVDVTATELGPPLTPITVHSRPIYPSSGQTVLSASDDAFGDMLVPGLYMTIKKTDNSTGEKTTTTGLVADAFFINEGNPAQSPTYLTVTETSGGVTEETSQAYHSAVLLNNAAFELDSVEQEWYSPYKYFPSSPSPYVDVDHHGAEYAISYDIPDGIRGAFISGNRMWVYDEHSIYASALGQYEIFTVDGTDNGGWSVTLPGTKLITSGIEYGGRPVFFTEDSIITVYGGYPSAFSTRTDEAWGVEYGSEQSLQLCAGSLYYLSKAGVMRYSGNVPVCISNDLTRYQLNNGRAGADGRHYYLYAENLARDNGNVTTEAYIYVWDVIRQSWHKWQYTGACGWNDSISAGGTLISNPIFTYVKYEPEDVSHVLFVNGTDKGVYAVPSYDRQKLIPGAIIRDGYFGYNDSRRWDIRLGRFYMYTVKKKLLKAVHIRARLLSQPRCKPDGGQDRAGRFLVRICYDDANAALDEYPIENKAGFEEIHVENQPQSDAVAGEIYAERSIYIPVIPRRCESFWLDISGRERWEFTAITFEYEVSSER